MDKLDQFKTDSETFLNLINRLKHIAAILLKSSALERFIVIYHTSIRYDERSDRVHFDGIIGDPGGVKFKLVCPFSMLTDMCDHEIIKWREYGYYLDRLKNNPEENKVDDPDALSTSGGLSKKQLIEYLQKADIADNAQLTLKFDSDTGKYYLFFYWSEGPGAFGQRAVNFDIESKEMAAAGWSWMERD